MRLWTVHPRYLDSRGLVALWREALLAQKVLRGETRGYRHHPQLARFRAHADPSAAIASYLEGVREEGAAREYAFDATKIDDRRATTPIVETRGQLLFEWSLLLAKLARRAPSLHDRQRNLAEPRPHPLFTITEGGKQPWEKGALPGVPIAGEGGMADIVHVCEHTVKGKDGTRWSGRVLAEPQGNVWIGWLEFSADAASGTVRTGEETSQPSREAVAYWASGLEPVYLEGALERARRERR